MSPTFYSEKSVYIKYIILCISEGHQGKERNIKIENYEYFPHNRTVTHKDTPKMFGGIEIFVKNTIFECYNISVVNRSVKGIQCLLLVMQGYHSFAMTKFLTFPDPFPDPNSDILYQNAWQYSKFCKGQ